MSYSSPNITYSEDKNRKTQKRTIYVNPNNEIPINNLDRNLSSKQMKISREKPQMSHFFSFEEIRF